MVLIGHLGLKSTCDKCSLEVRMGLLGCQLRHSISFRQMFQRLHHSYQIARGCGSATSGVDMVMQSFVQGLGHTEKTRFGFTTAHFAIIMDW